MHPPSGIIGAALGLIQVMKHLANIDEVGRRHQSPQGKEGRGGGESPAPSRRGGGRLRDGPPAQTRSAEADQGKASRVSESVRKALEEGQVASTLAGILGGTKDDKGKGNAMMMGPGGAQRTPQETAPPHPVSLAGSLESLRGALKTEIEKGELKVTLEQRGLVISLREAAFFASGDDAIFPGTYAGVGKIAQAIRELSAARSIAMLDLLETRFEVPSARMAVAGYADTVPSRTA